MEISPILSARLQKLWNALELRFLVLFSLFLQVILIATGNRRKYSRNKLLTALLWISYLSADSIATLALGVISQAGGNSDNLLDPKYEITVFWAPFLLMHLGGPDTITAYALADNELWSRHLLSLFGQVFVAIYSFIRSFTRADLNFLWMVIFAAGFVKYGERSWVLYTASKDRFRDSMVSGPDPGPNYAKLMDELVSKENEGYRVSLGKAIDDISSSIDPEGKAEEKISDNNFLLQKAYYFFKIFRKLFADLILSFEDRQISVSAFQNFEWEDAFSIVEIELGLVFDLFYTKSFLVFSGAGFILRIFSCLCTIAAFVGFLIIKKKGYPETEVIFTYFLLVGAIFIEFYAVLILSLSDITLIKFGWKWPETRLPKIFRCLRIVPKRKRWSNSVGQCNVLNHCLNYMPKRGEVCWCREKFDQYLEKLDQYLEKTLFMRHETVPAELKKIIYDELEKRATSGAKKSESNWKDNILIKEMQTFEEDNEVEFDQSILIWQMATDICYTKVEQPELEEHVKPIRERCRLLSDYMVYLLMVSPFMLPSGIGQIRFQDTIAEATEFFKFEKKLSKDEACEKLSQVDVRYRPSEVKGDRSKSVLFDACGLAKSLNKMDVVRRWEKINEAWVEMLTFAAAQCSWSDHAEKLSQGGELLTHVWLLMAHFGLTDQFQISKGYIRAKLELK